MSDGTSDRKRGSKRSNGSGSKPKISTAHKTGQAASGKNGADLQKVTSDLQSLKTLVAKLLQSTKTQTAAIGYSSGDAQHSGVPGGESSPALRAYSQAARSNTFPSAGPFEQVNKFAYDVTFTTTQYAHLQTADRPFKHLYVIMPLVTDRAVVVIGESLGGDYTVLARVKPALDIAAATSKHFPIAALCSSGASGTGNVNAQLGKVESFFVAEPLTQDVLQDTLEEHQSMPSIFSVEKRFKGTGDELAIGVPVSGVLNTNDRIAVLGASAQKASGACFVKTMYGDLITSSSENLLTQIPLGYTGRVRVNLHCTYDSSESVASPNFGFISVYGKFIAPQLSVLRDEENNGFPIDLSLWNAYGRDENDVGITRGVASAEFILDLESLKASNGYDISSHVLSALYFQPNADVQIRHGSFIIDLLDYVPGVDDQCLVFRHSGFGKDVTLNASVDCYSSFQHTVDNAFSTTVAGTWLPTSEHCAMQQRLLAGDVLTEALKVGRAGFFKNLWKGVSNVGKALLPVARRFAPEISKVANSYVPGSGLMISGALGHGAALGYTQ
jgi:hypothetical protein